MENKVTCIIVDDERHAIVLLSDSIRALFDNIEITGAYSSWQSALSALRSEPADLLFMDISMPGKNGMDILKLIPELDAEIIFVTAHEEYALKAFEFSTAGYLVKPVEDTDLSATVSRALKRIANKKQAGQNKADSSAPAQIGIPNNRGIDYVNINDILYLESINKCTRVVTRDKEIISTNNLGKFSELTGKYAFFQVHRAFIVNLNSVMRYEVTGNVVMTNNKKIPVARNSRNDFFKVSNVISRQ